MTGCPRTAAARARETKTELEACDAVLDAIILDPNAGPRAGWTLEVTITGDRLPAPAVQVLATHDCAVVSTTVRAPDVTQAVVAW